MVYCVIGKEMTFGKDIDARARVCDQRKMWCAYKLTPKKKNANNKGINSFVGIDSVRSQQNFFPHSNISLTHKHIYFTIQTFVIDVIFQFG